MIFRVDEWTPIQQRLVEAGYNHIPNGTMKDSFLKNKFLHFIIEFNTPEDEIMFILKWL